MSEHVTLTPDQEKARKRRNVLLALSIGCFMVLLFFITMARISGNGVQ